MLVTLGDVAAVLHVAWHSAREGDDREGGYLQGLRVVLLEWAVVQKWVLVTSMSWWLFVLCHSASDMGGWGSHLTWAVYSSLVGGCCCQQVGSVGIVSGGSLYMQFI